MCPFGGFDMPIQYADITTEHNAVRTNVGLFDVSHMGEFKITGPDAEKFVNYIFTNDISNATIGKIFYGMMLYPDGGTVDDLLVYKRGEHEFLLIPNAANIDKDFDWVCSHTEGFDVTCENMSEYYGQLALQGPNSEKVLADVLNIDASDLVFYTFKSVTIDGVEVIVSRTGYTGEDGFEIYTDHELTRKFWDQLINAGVQPCGLGCRDTLRFEVGLPLYGDELTKDISPIAATLGMFVKLDKENFIGKEACAKQKAEGSEMKLVGLELQGRGIARHGYEVLKDGSVVGYITTGYQGISVNKSLAFALVKREYGTLGDNLEVQIRKKVVPAVVVKKRFYDKHYKK